MSKLKLSPEEAAELSEKEIGEECVAEVTLQVTKNDDTGFEADIVSVAPAEGYEETEEEVVEEEEVGDKEESPRGKPALMIIMGKGKK